MLRTGIDFSTSRSGIMNRSVRYLLKSFCTRIKQKVGHKALLFYHLTMVKKLYNKYKRISTVD